MESRRSVHARRSDADDEAATLMWPPLGEDEAANDEDAAPAPAATPDAPTIHLAASDPRAETSRPPDRMRRPRHVALWALAALALVEGIVIVLQFTGKAAPSQPGATTSGFVTANAAAATAGEGAVIRAGGPLETSGDTSASVDRRRSRTTPPIAAAAGWMDLVMPFEVEIIDRGRLVGTSAQRRLQFPAGEHRFELVNEALGYRATQRVGIRPDEVSEVRPDVPNGLLHVNATPWAEVSIDGQDAGTTPLGNVSVPLGEHEVRFRHPALGEQVRRVVVTSGQPAHVGVSFPDLTSGGIAARAASTPEPAPALATPRVEEAHSESMPVVPPVAILQDLPPAPEALRRLRWSAREGILEITVNADGAVQSATIVAPSHPAYDAVLLAATKRWKYHPAVRGGVAVPYTKRIRVVLPE